MTTPKQMNRRDQIRGSTDRGQSWRFTGIEPVGGTLSLTSVSKSFKCAFYDFTINTN